MRQDKIKLGFCPIGKFVFSHAEAMRYKKLLEEKLKSFDIQIVTLDGVIEDGMVRDQSHVEPVVKHFRNKDIDAVFVPHCNFGTEGAVGMICSKLKLPVLLWGPRDKAPLPDGTRLTDTLCGLLASSKVLVKLGVPFTYIENCFLEEPVFEKGVSDFLRAVNVARAFRKGIRIGHIGQRIDFFWTTIINESELLDRFNVEIIPIDMIPFIRESKKRAQKNLQAYKKELAGLKKKMDIEGFSSDTPLINVLAVRDQMLESAEANKLDGIAMQSFMSIIEETGAYCSFAESSVAGRYPLGHESDIHGVISDLILRRVSLDKEPAFLADVTIRHPENDNAVLLWHFAAPVSLCHPEERVRLDKHWILPSDFSGMTHFRLKDGPITVARFDGERNSYKIAFGEGVSIEGPKTLNNYVWMEVKNWKEWESTLIEGPFIHHAGMVYGHYADALAEACKYIPGLEPNRMGSGLGSDQTTEKNENL